MKVLVVHINPLSEHNNPYEYMFKADIQLDGDPKVKTIFYCFTHPSKITKEEVEDMQDDLISRAIYNTLVT